MPKRDGRDLARVIATNAERDAVAVEKIAPDPELADDIVGLHAQQAAEKYLKAVLAYRGITYRRVHSITYLLGLLEDHDVPPPPRAAELETLTPWAPSGPLRPRHRRRRARPRGGGRAGARRAGVGPGRARRLTGRGDDVVL